MSMRIEAEKRLIGTVMHHGSDGLSIAVDVGCVASAFFDDRHQAIWGLMVELDKSGAPVSMVSVCQAAMTNGVSQFGGLAYVSSLPDSVAAVAAIPYWVGIVLEDRARRDAELIAMQLVEACRSGAPLGAARADAIGALDRLESEGKAPKMIDGATMSELLWDAVTTDGAQAPSLGCAVLDAAIGPALVPKRLSLIGARPGVGKTALSLNVCSRLLFRGGGVLFCSLEQPAQQIAIRMAAIDGAQTFSKLDGRPRGADPRAWHGHRWDAIVEHCDRVGGWGVRWQVDDKPGQSLAYIRARAMRAQRSMAAAGHRLRLVVIDYAQLCALSRSKGDQSTAEALGDLANGLAGLAKQLDVAVILLSQLNRDSEKANRPPRSSDLKASGGLEEAADVILLCHRPGNRPGHADSTLGLNRSKNRHGRPGQWSLGWEGEFLRVTGENQTQGAWR